MERREIEILHDPPQLVAQMRSLEFEAKAVGISIHRAHGSADDYVHALAYPTWGLRQTSAGITFIIHESLGDSW